MFAKPLSICATVSAVLIAALSPAAASEPQTVNLGDIGGAQLSIDESTIQTRGGKKAGWKQIEATIDLDKPYIYAAREVSKEVQTQDWDCGGARFRIVLRVYRTADGAFVASNRDRSDWFGVPEAGPEREAFKRICPQAAGG